MACGACCKPRLGTREKILPHHSHGRRVAKMFSSTRRISKMGIGGFLCGEESFLLAALQPKAAQPGGVSFGGERRALSCPSLPPGDSHLAWKIVPTEDKSLLGFFLS